MQVGDLVKKRWGTILPHQQGTAGIITEIMSTHGSENPHFDGFWIMVRYPDERRPFQYRPQEFEVISESR